MQALTRSKSFPEITQRPAEAVQAPQPVLRSPAFAKIRATVAACQAALSDEPTPAEHAAAAKAPQVQKCQFVNYGWLGSLSRTRSVQRRDIAAGLTKPSKRQSMTYAGGPAVQCMTVSLSFVPGWIAMGASRVRHPNGHRSADAVREDKTLRLLKALPEAIKNFHAEYAVMDNSPNGPAWRHRYKRLDKLIDTLEEAITMHPSERLRGSPEMRNALSDIAKEMNLGGLSLRSRPTPYFTIHRG